MRASSLFGLVSDRPGARSERGWGWKTSRNTPLAGRPWHYGTWCRW